MEEINNHHKEQIKLIWKLAEEGERFVNSTGEQEISELEYLTVCNRRIYEYFLDSYGKNFIFSSFSYLNYENKFSSVPYLFYAGEKYANVNSEDYWKAVSWNTDIPGSNFIIDRDLNKIINENYDKKKIGFIKELIWYLINVLIGEEGILTATELLLLFGKKDPRNIRIFQEKKQLDSDVFKKKDKSKESIERYLQFNLSDFEVPKIQGSNQFEREKGYQNIQDEIIKFLKSADFNYVSRQDSTEKIDFAGLNDKRIQSFKKLLNIYKLITHINPEVEYNFYFLRPITFYQEFRGVFLLGLNEKLRPLDILFIENLNYRILSDVMVKRITKKSQQEQLTVRTQLIFSVGHFLKHKTNRVPSLLDNVRKNITDAKISEEEIRRLIHRDLGTAKHTSVRIHKLALIIDIIAKSFDGKNYYLEEDIKNKTGYFTSDPIDIKGLIRTLYKEDYETAIDLEMKALEQFELKIEPFLFNTYLNKKILPSQLFYEEIFTEIFENCKLKAKEEETRKRKLKLTIEIVNAEDKKFECLVLSNELLDKTQFDELESLILEENEFRRIDKNIKKISGIVFLDTFLNVTDTGYLLFKRHSNEDGYFFSVALKIENLTIQKYD